jgi:FlaA1/EpsC-like NDP-sugar epimerase
METILVRMKKKRYENKRRIYKALYVDPEQPVPFWLKIVSKKRVLEVLLDGLLIVACFIVARVILEGQDVVFADKAVLRDQIIIVGLCCFASFLGFGYYRDMWRYIDMNAIGKYVKGVTAAALAGYFAFAIFNPGLPVYPKIMVVFWLLLLLAVSSSRLLFNFYSTYQKRELTRMTKKEKVLIYGAGDRGATVLSALIKEDNLDFRPVGFIDDDPGKADREIMGYKIFGDINAMESVVAGNQVERIIISSRFINGQRESVLKDICRRHKVKLCHFTVKFDPIDIEN